MLKHKVRRLIDRKYSEKEVLDIHEWIDVSYKYVSKNIEFLNILRSRLLMDKKALSGFIYFNRP